MNFNKEHSTDLIKKGVAVVCAICNLEYKGLYVLPCHHIFCETCINQLLVKELKCPECCLVIPQRMKQVTTNVDGLSEVTIKGVQGNKEVMPFEQQQRGNSTHFNDSSCNAGDRFHPRDYKVEITDKLPWQILASQISDDDEEGNQPAHQTINQSWYMRRHLTISDGNDNAKILKSDHTSVIAFGQAEMTTDLAFELKILKFDYFKYMAVGFTCIGHRIDVIPGLCKESIGFDSYGDVMINKKTERVAIAWKENDVIECSIKIPQNATNNDVVLAKVQFSHIREGSIEKEHRIIEREVLMNKNGCFPTVFIFEAVHGCYWDSATVPVVVGTPTKLKFVASKSL